MRKLVWKTHLSPHPWDSRVNAEQHWKSANRKWDLRLFWHGLEDESTRTNYCKKLRTWSIWKQYRPFEFIMRMKLFISEKRFWSFLWEMKSQDSFNVFHQQLFQRKWKWLQKWKKCIVNMKSGNWKDKGKIHLDVEILLLPMMVRVWMKDSKNGKN